MKMNFDLAQKDMMTSSPEPISSESSYPSFHYSGEEELDLPDSGTMTIRFKKSGCSESKDSKGKERYSCTVDVQEIVSVVAGGAKKNAAQESSDALDALARETEAEEED